MNFTGKFRWRQGARMALFVLATIFFVSHFFLTALAQDSGIADDETARTNPKSRDISVTASVPVQSAPPAPVLIAPSNGAHLTGGVVTFQWYEVTGALAALDRYELHLNGTIKFGFIHLTNQTTDDYTLTLENGIYTLTLKQDKWLPDGNYTWKIRVVDTNNKGTDSSTWSFSIDSTAPHLVVTEIDTQIVSISAADPSTYRTEPVEVYRRKPDIHGQTEALSEVQMVVKNPDGTTHSQYKVTATDQGGFSFWLNTIPADTAMRIILTAIDPSGNSRVLDGFSLIYKSLVITIPIPDILPINVTLSITFPFRLRELLPPPEVLPPILGGEAPIRPPKDENVSQQVFVRPVADMTPFFLGALFFLAAYVTAIFWLTGNSWRFYFLLWGKMIWLWLFWWRRLRDHNLQLWLGDLGTPAPFLAAELTYLVGGDHLKRRHVLSDQNGWTFFPREDQLLGDLKICSSLVQYPARTPAEIPVENPFPLQGESWIFLPVPAPKKRSDSVVVFPAKVEMLARALCARAQNALHFTHSQWVPRVFLGLSLVLTVIVTYFRPEWWAFALLFALIWIVVTDFREKLPAALRVYTKIKNEDAKQT